MSDNLYILRVRLSWAKGVWRELAIPGDMTLRDLHEGILDAFEWEIPDEDFAYSFHMAETPEDASVTYLPNDDAHSTSGIQLDRLGLEEDQTFVYVFGENEHNLFSIRVMDIEEPDFGVEYPDVVDERGESPDQDLAYEAD